MSNPFYNLSLPVVAAPMFLISGPKLVIECCKNGIVGTFPALNQRTTAGFEQWVVQIKDELRDHAAETGRPAAPFGVNLIVHSTNPRVQASFRFVSSIKSRWLSRRWARFLIWLTRYTVMAGLSSTT